MDDDYDADDDDYPPPPMMMMKMKMMVGKPGEFYKARKHMKMMRNRGDGTSSLEL